MTKPTHGSETTDLADQDQRHVEEMASLYEMALALVGTLDLDETLEVVLEQVQRALHYDTCLITLTTADGQALRVRAVAGEGAERMLGLEFPTSQGINAWIYREGKPTLVGDADTDPRRLHITGRTEKIRAGVGAPLVANGEVIGTIYATRRQPYSFTEAHLHFLTIAATQVTAAVQRARLLDQARRRAEEMETLYNIGAVMASSLDVDHVLQTIFEQAGRIMATEAFFVALYDADSEELHFRLAYEQDERLEPFTMSLTEKQGLTNHVVRTAQPLLIRDLEQERDQLAVAPRVIGRPTRSWLGVPIIFEDRVLGVISAQSFEPYAFTNRHLRLLSAIANQAGIGLRNAQLLADMRLLNADLQEMVSVQAQLLHTVEELTGPVVPIVDGVIILPLIGHVDERRAGRLLETLLDGVQTHKAQVVIVDITGVPVVDTLVAHYLMQSVKAARLLGAEAVLVGIRPDVAQALVNLGVELRDVVTRSNLQSGFQYALGIVGRRLTDARVPQGEAEDRSRWLKQRRWR